LLVAYRRTTVSSIFVTLLAAAAALAVGGTGCSAGGEGDRCTYFQSPYPSINGTDECQDGLLCTPYSAFSSNNINMTGEYDRCCPPMGVAATVVACQPGGNLGDASPSSGRDASFDVGSESTSDVHATDAKSDADTSSPEDSSHDAPPSDAPASDGKAPADAPVDG
jgi:hypothetical protein